eukprot:3775194-Rhodomonas_salina.1
MSGGQRRGSLERKGRVRRAGNGVELFVERVVIKDSQVTIPKQRTTKTTAFRGQLVRSFRGCFKLDWRLTHDVDSSCNAVSWVIEWRVAEPGAPAMKSNTRPWIDDSTKLTSFVVHMCLEVNH